MACGRQGPGQGLGCRKLLPAAARRLPGQTQAHCTPPAGLTAPGFLTDLAAAGLVPSCWQQGLGAGSEPLLWAGHGPPPQPPRGQARGRGGPDSAGSAPAAPALPAPHRLRSRLPLASWVPLPLGVHIVFPLGFKRTPGWGRVPSRRASVQAGAHNLRPSPPGEGLQGRCPRAWRGVCSLGSLSRSYCSKAAEKSAAVPLPVEAGGGGRGKRRPLAEQALPAPPPPAPTLSVRWDSAPSCVRPQHPGTVHMVYAPSRPVSLTVVTSGLAFQNLNPSQAAVPAVCEPHPPAGDLSQGILP